MRILKQAFGVRLVSGKRNDQMLHLVSEWHQNHSEVIFNLSDAAYHLVLNVFAGVHTCIAFLYSCILINLSYLLWDKWLQILKASIQSKVSMLKSLIKTSKPYRNLQKKISKGFPFHLITNQNYLVSSIIKSINMYDMSLYCR